METRKSILLVFIVAICAIIVVALITGAKSPMDSSGLENSSLGYDLPAGNGSPFAKIPLVDRNYFPRTDGQNGGFNSAPIYKNLVENVPVHSPASRYNRFGPPPLVNNPKKDARVAGDSVTPQNRFPSQGMPGQHLQQGVAVAVPVPVAKDNQKKKIPPFQEGHWQGIETIPLTYALAKLLKIDQNLKGVIIDDVTYPADEQGFVAGDLIVSVGQVETPNIEDFLRATDRVRGRKRVSVQAVRRGVVRDLVLTAMGKRLGNGNGETAPMIKSGAVPPHGQMGPCTTCHRIGTTGQLAVDQGDLLTSKAPPIKPGQQPIHPNRGECTACHQIVP